MQVNVISEKPKTIKDISVSIPKDICSSKNFTLNCETNNIFATIETQDGLIFQMLNQQHPLINIWLILSSVSICFLFGLLFIIH